MEQSSCTEDRIHHALERCLHGLGCNTPDKQLWNAGLCINRWSLEELVKRDPHNFLILLQGILRKTKEVLEGCQYELVVPLALLFTSTLLKTPYLAADSGVLQEGYLLFSGFLSWPEPCCSASKRLLYVITQELRAPGISFQKLVRKEQALDSNSYSKTLTVLLVSPEEDFPPEFLSVSEQLSGVHCCQTETTATLIAHAIQTALGAKYPVDKLHTVLRSKTSEELDKLLAVVSETLETAAETADPSTAREGLQHSMERLMEGLGLTPSAECDISPGGIETLVLPFAKCQMFFWEKDNFDNLYDLLTSDLNQDPLSDGSDQNELKSDDSNKAKEEQEPEVEEDTVDEYFQDHRVSTVSTSSRDSMFSAYSLSSSWSIPSTLSESSGVDSDFCEDTEEVSGAQLVPRKKPKKKSKSLLGMDRFSVLFKGHRSPSTCRRAQSMGFNGDVLTDYPTRSPQFKRSKSLPRQVRPPSGTSVSSQPASLNPRSIQRHLCVRKRPILSCSEGDVPEIYTLVRVVVFGGDREAGRLARAYSDLQERERKCPRLTRTCRLQFYFIPAKKRSLGNPGGGHTLTEGSISTEVNGVMEDSTTDIAQLMGMVDPWYERSVLSMLSLSSDVLCQATSKVDGDSVSNVSSMQRLPLLADQVLYYCRHADQPILVQLYQAELTLAGGERRREVFIHSLELGHTAGTRAVKAMGAASKRFGIDGDREAVPLTLGVSYNKVTVSGRSQWVQSEMVCTSINLCKACKDPEQPDSRMESLLLTMTEVLKRQGSKSKSYNQISVSEVKVNKVLVDSGEDGTTFAVCLDQDEKKIIQSVTRCEVSLCCKLGSSSDWQSYKALPGQIQPLHPSYCSLLCLPIASFSGSSP